MGSPEGAAFERSLRRSRVAYFSMEIALRPEVHTYSGGLGVLAGDTARSAADLDLPMVFVSLLSRDGYVLQEIAAGAQVSKPNPWEPAKWAVPLGAMIAVAIGGRDVWIRAWLYWITCPVGNVLPALLLDTDLDQNHADDRHITDRLYGGDAAYRLKQEIVLGIGGLRLLRALGFDVSTYHLNEGHAALLTLELLRQTRRAPGRGPSSDRSLYDYAVVRDRCVFTTHTPVEAGFDRFDYRLVGDLLGDVIELDELRALAGNDRLNMTQLALNLCGYVNGVARSHAETTRRMFPGYQIKSITNGVHPHTWTHRSFANLFEKRFPNWAHEPEVLVTADQIDDVDIWRAHQDAKSALLKRIELATGISMNVDRPLIGFARRMTAYKRPDLLFQDVEALAKIAVDRPFQIVLAGLAHPADEPGQRLIEDLHRCIHQLEGRVPAAYLPNYDMLVAADLVAGSDIWLNTPLPPLEASGTSGMKAALNGVLNLSVLDGWWVEGCVDGVTGWAISGDGSSVGDSMALRARLADTVLPLYYDDHARWVWMMKQSISKIGPTFSSQRMMRRYAAEAYLR